MYKVFYKVIDKNKKDIKNRIITYYFIKLLHYNFNIILSYYDVKLL